MLFLKISVQQFAITVAVMQTTHYFGQSLCPNGGGDPTGELADDIVANSAALINSKKNLQMQLKLASVLAGLG